MVKHKIDDCYCYTTPRNDDIKDPNGENGETLRGLGFGLAVVGKDGERKPIKGDVKIDAAEDDDKKSTVITVEPNLDSSAEPPASPTSYIYLVEGNGVTIDQTGRSAKFSVDTVDLKVENGKVTVPDDPKKTDAPKPDGTENPDAPKKDPKENNNKKLVNAGNLSSVLNELGWKVSANGEGSTTSTVKSGEEVVFKGEGGVTVTTTTESGKHVVTIKAEQPQGGAAGTAGANGKSAYEVWKAIPGNEDKSVDEFIKAIKGEKGEQGERGLQGEKGEKGEKGDPGRQVVEGKGITATPNADNTLTIAAKTKTNGGISAQDEGLSIDTDGTTITLKSGKVSAVTGTITAGETPSVATADANKLAKAGEVVEAIKKAAKTEVAAGSGIKVESTGNNKYTVSADLPFTKDAADKSITLNDEGVIHNVANGRVAKDSKDAVNGSQLHAVEGRLNGNMDKLNHRIDKMGKRADAGTASAIATANLLQSYRPGLSAATAAVGQYHGQSAVAVGYSRLSDNGKYGVKFSLGANTQGNVGAGAGVAYFW